MGKQATAALILWAAAGVAHAEAPPSKFQCWTDEKGVRACGDHVPPQYAKQERQVIDSLGRVVDIKSREKTPEELQAEANARKLAAEMVERQRKQAEYDRFLLDTYATEAELQKARDERITAIDGRMKLVASAIVSNEATLKMLKERAANVEKNKANAPPVNVPPPRPPPPPPPPPAPTKPDPKAPKNVKKAPPPKPPPKPRTLPQQIADFEASLVENNVVAKQLVEERATTLRRFDEDIARWRELKSGTGG